MKKKDFIGLSTLLLVLLLGLFTTSYAWEYDFTQTDMEKVAQWLYSNNTSFKNKAVTLYNTLAEHECNTYIMWTYRYNGTYVIYLATLNKSQITKVNNSHNTNTMNITFTGDCYWGSAASNENNHYYTQTNGSNWGKGSGGQYRSPYLFFNNDLTNDVANNPNLEGPYENVEVIGPFEEPVTFAFIEEPTTEHGNVYEFENVPVYQKTQENDLLLGFLMIPDSITITDFRIDRYYFQGGDWQQKVVTYNENNPYLLKRYYTRVNNVTSYNYWYKQENLYKDNIYYIRWRRYNK